MIILHIPVFSGQLREVLAPGKFITMDLEKVKRLPFSLFFCFVLFYFMIFSGITLGAFLPVTRLTVDFINVH